MVRNFTSDYPGAHWISGVKHFGVSGAAVTKGISLLCGTHSGIKSVHAIITLPAAGDGVDYNLKFC
jgi:hypothetical protein